MELPFSKCTAGLKGILRTSELGGGTVVARWLDQPGGAKSESNRAFPFFCSAAQQPAGSTPDWSGPFSSNLGARLELELLNFLCME